MAGPSYAGLGSGSGLVGEGSSELGSELQNCWVAFEHAGDRGVLFGEPSAASSSGSVSESSSYGMHRNLSRHTVASGNCFGRIEQHA